jgi:hypothetical protein
MRFLTHFIKIRHFQTENFTHFVDNDSEVTKFVKLNVLVTGFLLSLDYISRKLVIQKLCFMYNRMSSEIRADF